LRICFDEFKVVCSFVHRQRIFKITKATKFANFTANKEQELCKISPPNALMLPKKTRENEDGTGQEVEKTSYEETSFANNTNSNNRQTLL
jgi:hypothetical protein